MGTEKTNQLDKTAKLSSTQITKPNHPELNKTVPQKFREKTGKSKKIVIQNRTELTYEPRTVDDYFKNITSEPFGQIRNDSW